MTNLLLGDADPDAPDRARSVDDVGTAAERVTSSVVRDLLHLAERSEVISLAGGLPDVSLLDADRVHEASVAAAAATGPNGPVALQYGPTPGLSLLREVLAERLGVAPGSVAVTTGSQQALDLVARAVVRRGDVVLTQAPAYLGAVQAFRAAGAEVVGVPGDDQGLRTEEVALLLERGLQPRAIYVVADHHNPTGAVMSPGRRFRLRSLADSYGFLIVEDAAYRDLHWGPPTRPLFRPGERTVHIGSSSKVLAPGLRVGWLAAPDDVLDAVLRLKQAADLHTPTWNQMVVAHLLSDRHHAGHLERIRREYRTRAHALHRALTDRLGDRVRLTSPDGGMFLWMESLDGTDTDRLFERAIRCDVAFVPGSAFAVPDLGADTTRTVGACRTARLSFAGHDPHVLEEAADRLAACW